jgi:hypothetical protein
MEFYVILKSFALYSMSIRNKHAPVYPFTISIPNQFFTTVAVVIPLYLGPGHFNCIQMTVITLCRYSLSVNSKPERVLYNTCLTLLL